MRISDWSSDVCSSDLARAELHRAAAMAPTIIRITRVGMATWWRRREGFAIGRGEGGAAGLVQPWLKDPALLLLAGEGARRADEGARAQRSVLVTLACGTGATAKAARFEIGREHV